MTSNEDIDNVERYLQALAISTRPNKEITLDLLKLLKEKTTIPAKTKASLINTLGSLCYRLARLPGNNYTTDVVVKTQSFFVDALKSCSEPSCLEQYLHGLRNLQSLGTIDLLFQYVYNEERCVSIAAAKALAQFPASTWKLKDIPKFKDIFYQKSQKFDSSARTLALDVLLANELQLEDIKEIIHHLRANDRAFEVKKYLLEKVKMMAKADTVFEAQMNEIFKNDTLLNNYHIFGQKGLTTALSRKFSLKSPFNGTLTSIQEIFGGVLKRGVVDMSIDTEKEKYSFFTVISQVIFTKRQLFTLLFFSFNNS